MECPFCETKLENESKNIQDMTILSRLKLSVPVKCTMTGNGCTWEGDISQFWNHLSVCDYFPRPCPHNCDPNIFMPKELLKTHLSDKCPMKSIACEYKWAGCTAVFNRIDMAIHMKNNALIHNELLAKVAKNYKTQLHMLQAEINQMKEGHVSPVKPHPKQSPLKTPPTEEVIILPPPMKKRKVTFSHQSPDIIEPIAMETKEPVTMTTIKEDIVMATPKECVAMAMNSEQKEGSTKRSSKPADMNSLISPIVGYANNMDKMSKQCPPSLCRCVKPDWRTLMIKCQSCDTWYHTMCAHVINSKARDLTEYICLSCKKI